MNRRRFLGTSLGTAAALFPAPGDAQKVAPQRSATDAGKLAGLSLPELREQYRRDLFDDFLPFMDRYVVDHEYGGFMCNTDRTGANITQTKNTWFEGRGIWVYSFLYNHLAREQKYLEVARKSMEFILKARPSGEDSLWPRQYERDGTILAGADTAVYGDLFVAEGLAEYSQAAGEKKYWDIAREILLKCIRIYDRPDYEPIIGQTYLGPDARPFPGARIQGVWMVLILVVTQMLEKHADPELEKIADRCVDAVINRHYNPEFRLNNELLNHDLSRPANEYAQLVYTGHAIETLWMLLAEAVRRKDKALFETLAERFRRHVQVAWDDVYGGVFRNLQNVDQNVWSLDKVLWAQEEVLVGSLLIVEHTGAQWARDMFARMYSYVREKYPLKRYGSPLWIQNADRRATREEYGTRVEHYHHPRHLMLNLLSLDRIIKRGGRVSGSSARGPARMPDPLPAI